MADSKHRNMLDGTAWEWGGAGFWILHLAAVAVGIWLVVRVFALR